MSKRAYTLKCICGFEKRHEGRPPLVCSHCGTPRVVSKQLLEHPDGIPFTPRDPEAA